MAKQNGNSTAFDSDQSYLGTVYAKALLGATEKSGNSGEVLEELDSLIDDVLQKLQSLDATLGSPRVALPEKLAVLDKAFQGRMSDVLLRFLKVVVEHGRFGCLRAMRRAARRLYNESRGLLEVEVRTAAPVSDETLDAVTARLRDAMGSELDVVTNVDPALLGGIVVRVGDTVYDGSVANRLKRVRETALHRAAQEIRDSFDKFADN